MLGHENKANKSPGLQERVLKSENRGKQTASWYVISAVNEAQAGWSCSHCLRVVTEPGNVARSNGDVPTMQIPDLAQKENVRCLINNFYVD